MRVFNTSRQANSAITFNPGFGSNSRFAFFPSGNGQKVPVLYAAQTENSAVAESLLHYIPASGGLLYPRDYQTKALGHFTVNRKLTVAGFRGLGLRQLGITAKQLTDTPAVDYHRTVRWAGAAHKTGFDGVIWTSSKCNNLYAIMLFGDRATANDLSVLPGGRSFMDPANVDWLTGLCGELNIQVLR